MNKLGKQLWWLYVLNGVIAILLSAVLIASVLTFPVPALAMFFMLFGAFLVAKGAITVAAAVKNRKLTIWRSLLVNGLSNITLGALMFVWTESTAVALMLVLGAWMFVTGIFDIVHALKIRQSKKIEWSLALSGLVALPIGALFILLPAIGMLSFMLVFGGYCAFTGFISFRFGLRLRHGGGAKAKNYEETGSEHAEHAAPA